jgi:hypothetical protein
MSTIISHNAPLSLSITGSESNRVPNQAHQIAVLIISRMQHILMSLFPHRGARSHPP